MSLAGLLRFSRSTLPVGFAATFCACAGFGLFSAEEEPAPLPATVPELRAAIDVERSRLMDLVSEPAEDEERWSADADVMVQIAERMSRLQRALETLEGQGEAPVESATPAP